MDDFKKLLMSLQETTKNSLNYVLPQDIAESKLKILAFIIDLDIDFFIAPIMECILHALLNLHTEAVLDDEDMMLSDKYAAFINKVLTVSKEPINGQMIHNLIIILFILSAYLNESKSCTLASTIFNTWGSAKGNCEAFLMLFEPTLDQIYHNESGLSFKLSNWKIGRIYKAILKWLTNKIDAFSSSGISIKILEDLYIKTNVS